MKLTSFLKLAALLLLITIGCSKDSVEEITQPIITGDLPTLITDIPSSVTPTTVMCGGEIKTEGNLQVTAKGLCWDTAPNPTVALTTKSINGFGIGSFSFGVSKLKPLTTYYIRAYATNAKGTAYGNEVSFTTLKEPLPTVTTTPISEITSTTAKSGGNITDDSGLALLERGVCWSESPNPTATLPTRKPDAKATIGEFTSEITNLQTGKKYYARAYAINNAGITYGEEFTFTAL